MWIRNDISEEPFVQGGYVSTSEGRVHYRTSERSDGIPMLMLHQSPLSSAQYRRAIPELAEAGIRPFALDTPGHGSSFTPGEEWDMDRYADTVLAVADELGLDRFVLFGRATGATLAVETAIRGGDRIIALPIHGLPVYRDDERAERLVDFAPPLELTSDGAHVRGVWDRIMDQYPTLEPVLATQFLLDYLAAGPDYARAYRAVFRYDMPARFPHVTQPYRIWFGEHDRLGFMRARPKEIAPDADQRQFDGEDDFVAYRDPVMFATALAEFVHEVAG